MAILLIDEKKMNALEEQSIQCPYCSEIITLLIDCSLAEQSYIEDCNVCCQPILIEVKIENGTHISVTAKRENE
jgi:hypothetical protein